jgi:hypothetical protein
MDTTNKMPKFEIIRTEFSMGALASCGGKDKELLDGVKNKRYKGSELNVSRRVLSHWRTLGLIDLYGDDKHPTRLSFLELFWLQSAIELRTFGMSLEKIYLIKAYFFDYLKTPLLETYLLRSIYEEDKDFFLVVSSDGRADVGTSYEIDVSEALGFLEDNYIKLNFNIIKNKFVTFKLDTINQKKTKLSVTDKEISILELIREGQYKEITLKFNNGIVSHILKKTFENNPDPIKEIKKLFGSNDGFCNISIHMANGKFVHMEKEIMKKP